MRGIAGQERKKQGHHRATSIAGLIIWIGLNLPPIGTCQPIAWEYVASSPESWQSFAEDHWENAVLTEHPRYSPDSTRVLWTIHRPFTDTEKQWILGLDSTAVFIPSSEIENWLKANGWEKEHLEQ